MEIYTAASLPMIGAADSLKVLTVRGSRLRVVPLIAPTFGAVTGTAMPGSQHRTV